jgi:hypothetical protein
MKTYFFKNYKTQEVKEIQARSWRKAEQAMGITNEWPQCILKQRMYLDWKATMDAELFAECF